MSPALVTGYVSCMNNRKYYYKAGDFGLFAGVLFLASITGCVSYEDRPPQGNVYFAPAGVVVMQEDYVYYPNYECYYSESRHQYAYREGNAWVSRPAPRGVTVNVLMSSPSVRMDFHDSPANHHAVVVQKYPKNWKPSGPNSGQKENHKDDQHGGNDGR